MLDLASVVLSLAILAPRAAATEECAVNRAVYLHAARDYVVLAVRSQPGWWGNLLKRDSGWRMRRIRRQDGAPDLVKALLSRSGSVLHVTWHGGHASQVDLLDVDVISPDRSLKYLPDPDFRKPAPCALSEAHAKVALTLAREARKEFGLPRAETWHPFAVDADPSLYAPVLQFHPSERVFPEAFGIWGNRRTLDSDVEKRASFAGYLRETGTAPPTCHAYFQQLRPDGSRVLQYWFYYRYDYWASRSPTPSAKDLKHLHDSEHLFVVVDPLGGSPRIVIGAGHGVWAPNSIYDTRRMRTRGDSWPTVKLPIRAYVELGQHATIPEIDGNWRFEPGVDINRGADNAETWGPRDAPGKFLSRIRGYDPTLSSRVPTEATYAIHLQRNWAVPGSVGCRYELRSFPSQQAFTPGEMRREAAEGVLKHGDAAAPTAILKPAMYPKFFARIGWAGHGLEVGLGSKVRLRDVLVGRVSVNSSTIKSASGLSLTFERHVGPLLGLYATAGPSDDRRAASGLFFELPVNLPRWAVPSGVRGTFGLNVSGGVRFDARTPAWKADYRLSTILLFGSSQLGLRKTE